MSRRSNQFRLRRQFENVLTLKEGEPTRFPADQGDGAGTVKVPNKPRYIYVRRLGRSRFEECLNVRAPIRYDLPVVVGYLHELPGVLQVLDIDWVRIAGPGNYAYVPGHHESHEFQHDEGGDDVVWIQKQAVIPLLCHPTSPVSMRVIVLEDNYPWLSGWKLFPGATSEDLTARIPGVGESRFVLIYVDGATNLLGYLDGTVFPTGWIPAIAFDFVPAPPIGSVPVAAILLSNGMASIDWGRIYDLRLFNQPMGGSVSPGPHSLLDPTVHDDTSLDSPTRGSLVYGNPPTGTTSQWDEFPIGVTGTFLGSTGVEPVWTTPPPPGPHAILSAIHSDAAVQAVSRGSLIVGSVAPDWDEFPIGATGTFLKSTGLDPIWETPHGYEVELEEIGAATYDDVQDWINNTQSSMYVAGCEITENAALDGTIDMAAGEGYIKIGDTDISGIVSFDIGADAAIAIAAGINYIFIDYNGGAPIFKDQVARPNRYTELVIGRVFKDTNGHLHILQGGQHFNNFPSRVHDMLVGVFGMQRASGLEASEGTMARVLNVTAGETFQGINPFTLAQFDGDKSHDITGGGAGGTISANDTIVLDDGEGDITGDLFYGQYINIMSSSNGNDGPYTVESFSWDGSNTTIVTEENTLNVGNDTGHIHPETFTVWYYNGVGGAWVEVNGQSQIDNANYDDITAVGLVALTPNRYGVHWVFSDFDGHINVLYGQGDYTLANAQDAVLPASLPPLLGEFSALIAKIIIKRSAAAFTSIVSAWITPFAQASVNEHNDLTAIDGGAAGEYYHFTQAQHTSFTVVAAAGNALVSTGVNTWGADLTPLWMGTHTWGSGFAVMPTDATGQNLGDATHRWDLHTQAVFFEGTDGNNTITVPDNVADALHIWDSDGLEYMRIVSTDANPYVLFDPAGAGINVGIGTAAPGSIAGVGGPFVLEVTPSVYVQGAIPRFMMLAESDTHNAEMQFYKSRVGPAIVQNGDVVGAFAARGYDGVDYATTVAAFYFAVDGVPAANVIPGRVDFYTANAAGVNTFRMRIDSSGYVGVNIAPSYRFDVYDDSGADAFAANFFQDGDDANRYGIRVQCGDDDAKTAGTAYPMLVYDGDGTYCGGLRIVAGVVSVFNASDAKGKTDIRPTSRVGLDEILALSVEDYKRIDAKGVPGPIQTGFVAQDVKEIMPEAVCKVKDTLSISQTTFIPMIVKAIQEIDGRLGKLEVQ